MRRLNTREKVIYSAGNFGNGVAMGTAMFWLVYFFFPPADASIPYVIPQGSLFIGLTVLGIILAANRLLDAVTDPWIANICNRSRNPKGKYIPMMRLAAPGVLFFMVAIFYLPDPGVISTANVVWLTVCVALQALFATMYSIPYYALQVKIAPHTNDKLDLNTIMGAFWFMGMVVASFASIIWGILSSDFGMGRVESIQTAFIILGVVGTLFLLAPAVMIRESDYEEVSPEQTRRPKFSETIQLIRQDRIFLRFMVMITLYYLATFMFETGMTYYITVLGQLSESVLGGVTSVTGVLSLLCYPLVNKLAKTRGKKFMLLKAYMFFGITLALLSFMGLGGISPYAFIGMLILLSPVPQAALSILPGTMTADLASYSRNKTGQDNASMYMAGFWFSQKIAGTLAMLLFTSFLLLGKDVGDDLGIRAVAIFAALLCFSAYLIGRGYNEKEVMACQDTGTAEGEPGKPEEPLMTQAS